MDHQREIVGIPLPVNPVAPAAERVKRLVHSLLFTNNEF